MESKLLHLTLSKKPFDVMVTGEKKSEFREPSKWIASRLLGKEYNVVRFVNGYGRNRPYFIAEFKGYRILDHDTRIAYSNGLVVDIESGGVEILLGEIIVKGNINQKRNKDEE